MHIFRNYIGNSLIYCAPYTRIVTRGVVFFLDHLHIALWIYFPYEVGSELFCKNTNYNRCIQIQTYL